jgi:hypothetical protein
MKRLAALVLAAVLLAGCGADDEPTKQGEAAQPASPSTESSDAASTPASSPPPSPPPTAPPVDEQELRRIKALTKLAIKAQEAAAQLDAAATSIPPRDEPVIGADVSWPQCPAGMGIPHKMSTGAPMPLPEAAYVVIGLTNGPGFHANPCLADQVAFARDRGLLVAAYSVISWPDETALKTYKGLHEAGYAQAQFNLQSMKAAGLDSPIVWLDVESVPYYDWSTSVSANAEVVLGAAQGYVDAGYRVGVYSTPHIWETIVGDLSLGVPEWRAAGQTSRQEAESRCGPDWSIQGGEAVLAQWVEDDRDKNVTCPVIEARLGEFFAPAGG